MAELPLILRILGTPTKLFYDAFRHTQRVVAGEATDDLDEVNPFVGFRISLFMGAMALIGIFNTLDRRTPFLVVVAFTGLSCAWQLRPFWRATRDMRGRVPRPGLANWFLSHHAASSVVLEAVGNGAMALYLGTSGFFSHWDGKAALGIVLMLMWLTFNRFIFINLAVLELLKQHVASDLRFVVFRRFQSAASKDAGFNERHRQIVLPVLGAFGKVSVVHDISLEQTPAGPNPDTEQINADADDAIKFSHDEWVHGVSQLIRESDIAVFHWGRELSQSMLLEFRIARQLLTPHRLILVADGDKGAMSELAKQGLDLSMHVLDLKDGYGGFLRQLRVAIKEMSKQPVEQPKSDPDVPMWNGAAWDALKQGVAQSPAQALPSGRWRLPTTLGGSDCDLVMFAGHLMGRGRDETGWFYIQGSYATLKSGTSLTATQYYVDGDEKAFRGEARDSSIVAIHVADQPGEDMRFLATTPA